MGTLTGWGWGAGQGSEEDKFLPVLDIFYVFLQTHSLSTLLHSPFKMADLPGPHDCIPMLSGSSLVSISGQHWQKIGGRKGGEWGQGTYYPFPSLQSCFKMHLHPFTKDSDKGSFPSHPRVSRW